MSEIEAAFFGALGRDAEPKTSKAGKPYLRLSVRVGNDDAAQWVSVLCFDADAIAAADRYLRGARCYVESRLSTTEWTAADGAKRFGLSVMSWHTRIPQIGRNRPRKPSAEKGISVAGYKHIGGVDTFHDDEIPFAPEVR